MENNFFIHAKEINIKVMPTYTQYPSAPEKLLNCCVNFFTPRLEHWSPIPAIKYGKPKTEFKYNQAMRVPKIPKILSGWKLRITTGCIHIKLEADSESGHPNIFG